MKSEKVQKVLYMLSLIAVILHNLVCVITNLRKDKRAKEIHDINMKLYEDDLKRSKMQLARDEEQFGSLEYQ